MNLASTNKQPSFADTSLWRVLNIWQNLSWWGKCAFIGLSIVLLIAIFAPFITPYKPDAQDLESILAPMSAQHFLGTDYLGRDVYTRLVYGARLSLFCTFIILGCIVLLGVTLGGLSGFVGGQLDRICMRICDVFISVPTVALSLFLVGVLGAGLENVMIAIILTHWAWYARIVRSIVFNLRHKEYVRLSYTFGESGWQRFKRHIMLPILTQCIVLTSMDIGHIMLHIAGLSFLGLGVQPPTAEWGIMLNEAREYMWDYPMLIVYPGMALFVSVALCNLLGEALRDTLGMACMMGNAPEDTQQGSKEVKATTSAQSLSIENLHIKIGDKTLLNIKHISVRRGECVALLGKSGSGKSLSALALQGFLPSNLVQPSGDVRLNGALINPVAYRARAFACIMQNPLSCFNPLLSIHNHIKESLKSIQKPYDRDFIHKCLRDAGLNESVLEAYPCELSGGMLQRVSIALALLTEAPFIIADEPTSDLDKSTESAILDILRQLQKQKGIGILLITHNLQIIAHYAQRVYVIDEGAIIESISIAHNRLYAHSHEKDLQERNSQDLQNIESTYTPRTQTTRYLQQILNKELSC
ncbi:nickel ABC transporter permease subunit NikC [Helicobacter jaachi]|uniref:Nickel ABC transporter permease subunit NikC n=1 Tax=Helicobacter jaachi TaxID=1677920 RepID=A0A4U8T9W6_9HELI|nr:nickel ABC transporter permease subunit NikC [Helicobacter jaachi]TLD96611.1 nickel ABC transporter permease subunit NikC [Helicobacter jaachi]